MEKFQTAKDFIRSTTDTTEFKMAGVKGMKWGVRNKRKASGDSSSNSRSSNGQKSTKMRRKRVPVSKMTTKQLQDRVNRINLENQYKRLTQTKRDKAINFMVKAATDAVGNYAEQVIKKEVYKTLNSMRKPKG